MSAQSSEVGRILVVDDEPDLLTLYELSLLREGHQVLTAASVTQARHLLQQQSFDLLITDMRLPDGDGLELLREVMAAQRGERSIMITAYGSAEHAVEALKSGAFDYLTKPVDLKQFRQVVRAALQAPAAAPGIDVRRGSASQSALVTDPAPAASQPTEEPAVTNPCQAALVRLVGESDGMRSVKRRIGKVARSMAPVLVHGESGTGKELVARAIHACSHRSDGPFVPVNCGAIPENLIEAEFFGARKGSYTGAAQDRDGFFQAAAGGTLFLDEIGELPLTMQAKLLRAIQERRVRPLGATEEIPVDVRIVSATHRVLANEVDAGRFRQDLYYRLNVIEIVIPPLRQRREDIPAICEVLLQRIASESGQEVPVLDATQLNELMDEPLPGNVRELENMLYRVVALGSTPDTVFGALNGGSDALEATPAAAEPVDLELPLDSAQDQGWMSSGTEAIATGGGTRLAVWLDQQEQSVLLQAMDAAGQDLAQAAADLGLSPRQLHFRLQRLGLVVPG